MLPPFLPNISDTTAELPASPADEPQKCLSFNRDMCPPLNLSIQTKEEQRVTHKRCGLFVSKERTGITRGGRFCGRRLKRLNPCWSEANVVSCLPHFFIIGEMKCGTTTLYNHLRNHPQVVVPRVKEPRFLQPGRFAQTTVSRYKVNFDAVAPHEDRITFDASPVYLRSDIARAWIPRWLPEARLITLVREPTQRAYSHWKMGRAWLSSKCSSPQQREQLEIAMHLVRTSTSYHAWRPRARLAWYPPISVRRFVHDPYE